MLKVNKLFRKAEGRGLSISLMIDPIKKPAMLAFLLDQSNKTMDVFI